MFQVKHMVLLTKRTQQDTKSEHKSSLTEDCEAAELSDTSQTAAGRKQRIFSPTETILV